jgi:hypothetical protein
MRRTASALHDWSENMKMCTEYFHTESEALAFVRGVELVNDAAVAISGPRLQEGFKDGEENAWAVAVHDGRKVMDNETCPICGACDSAQDITGVDGPDYICGQTIEMPNAHECDNCAEVWTEGALTAIQDYFQRVEAGGIVPSGECPKCGALCYPTKGGA